MTDKGSLELVEKVAEDVAQACAVKVVEWMNDLRPNENDELDLIPTVREALAATPLVKLREALEKCRKQFAAYERHHLDEAEKIMLERDTSKVAMDRLAKAERNREMVAICVAALNLEGG